LGRELDAQKGLYEYRWQPARAALRTGNSRWHLPQLVYRLLPEWRQL